jgi:hypothetical protein
VIAATAGVVKTTSPMRRKRMSRIFTAEPAREAERRRSVAD